MVSAYSYHAQERMLQRNLTDAEVEFILTHGEPLYNAGVIFYQLKKRNLPLHQQRDQRLAQLVGATVVVCSRCDMFVITTYRNGEAFKRDRRKARYNFHEVNTTCPYCGTDH